MIVNLIIGFVIPFILMMVLYSIDKKVLLVIAPITSALAYTVNTLGLYFGFWDLYPFGNQIIVHVTYDVGVYPMLSAWMIYLIRSRKINSMFIIFIFTLLTTIAEGMGLLFGRVIYGRGWNIGWTFMSYFIPYLIVYRYYLTLKKLKVF